ncbi:Fatty acid desaturase [Planctopirus ephydatiae]|uniref:Fatty acid desaturase n=2 Tax=Planctopirus ephydatiae TaxID=2528019 RepID=A0A518GIQ1_9PLAN|nr:Fatty acid desaturase [Planctopirus ephydatiae]
MKNIGKLDMSPTSLVPPAPNESAVTDHLNHTEQAQSAECSAVDAAPLDTAPLEAAPLDAAPSQLVAPQLTIEDRVRASRASSVRVVGENNPALTTMYESYSPRQLRWDNIDWPVVGWLVLMHAGAIAAPFFFTWTALGVFLVMHWLTGSIGICLAYHRCLSHRSLRLRQPFRFLCTLCGVLSGEGSPLFWTATHRLHHQRSDHEGDPHSPFDGQWWSHIAWLFVRRSPEAKAMVMRRYVPDLIKDPMLQFFERYYGLILIGSGAFFFGIGFLAGGLDWYTGLSVMLWGLCLRMTLVYHGTWFVNSATHLWGYRNYDTRDASKNLWWVAIFAYGEGWHNNHHAHPNVAPAGHKWWEFDITWWSIKALRAIGMAYDIDDRIPQNRSAAEGC